MDTYRKKRIIMSTKPLKTAVFYDFYMFVQLLALILLGVGAGRLAFFIDRTSNRNVLTPLIIRCLEWIANFSVVRK
jgi:hypothetical protein